MYRESLIFLVIGTDVLEERSFKSDSRLYISSSMFDGLYLNTPSHNEYSVCKHNLSDGAMA